MPLGHGQRHTPVAANLHRYHAIVRGFTHDYRRRSRHTFGWASPIHVYLFS